MKQININVTPEFDRDLREYMRRRKLKRKSDAIRQAVKEAVERQPPEGAYDFRKLLGMGLKAPLNPHPKFTNEDELWS